MSVVILPALPNNGDKILAADYSVPITLLAAAINGNLDSTNIAELIGSKIKTNTLPFSALDTASSNAIGGAWTPLPVVPTVTANNGQREHVLTFAGVDYTDRLTKGTKIQLPRATTPLTTALNLVSGQYASRATGSVNNFTFTNNFTVEAWVKLSSYPTSAPYTIISRLGANSGFQLAVQANGRVNIGGYNASYSNARNVESLQAIPLNRWVHVAATLDMAGFTNATCKVYLEGVDVPTNFTSAGTNPTALVQQGSINIGGYNDGGGNPFTGQIAEARVWSQIRSAAQIRDNANQAFTTAQTNLVAYYKGNNLTDSSGSGNDLTNVGTTTVTDYPFKPIDYVIVTSDPVFSTNTTLTVFNAARHPLTNGGASTAGYSTAKAPYKFPGHKDNWTAATYLSSQIVVGLPGYNADQDSTLKLTVPTGDWEIKKSIYIEQSNSTAGQAGFYEYTKSAAIGKLQDLGGRFSGPYSANYLSFINTRGTYFSTTAQDVLTEGVYCTGGAGSVTHNYGNAVQGILRDYIVAELAYI